MIKKIYSAVDFLDLRSFSRYLLTKLKIFISPFLSIFSDSGSSKGSVKDFGEVKRFGGGMGSLRDRRSIGLTIRIVRGPYKGSIGIVKDATATTVRVELHSSCQTITVDRSHIMETVTPGVDGSRRSIRMVDITPAHLGAQTPMYGLREGSKTPLHGSHTPIHGTAQTPIYDGKLSISIEFFKNKQLIIILLATKVK